MTLAYRVWCLLRERPSSAPRIAARLDLPYKAVENAFRNLRRHGHIVSFERRGCKHVYAITGTFMLPEGRGQQPGSRDNLKLGPGSKPRVKRLTSSDERRDDEPIANGYGKGTIELERAWR